VFHILENISSKNDGLRAQYERVINVLVHDVSAAPQQSSYWLACVYQMFHRSSDRVLQPNVFHILAHTPEKFNDNRIQDKRDIIFLVLTIPPALQPTMQSVGTCVPKNPLLHLTNPFTHMCIMNLHMFPQVSVAIGATMAEILMPQYLSSLLSRKQLCHLLCILVS